MLRADTSAVDVASTTPPHWHGRPVDGHTGALCVAWWCAVVASLAPAAAASAVADAVGSGAVPRHANKEWTVMAKVGWPPVL
jgi:hypothetical protein